MSTDKFTLQKGDALLVVDIQYDFLPGGSLGVPGGDQIIPVLNKYIKKFRQADLPVLCRPVRLDLVRRPSMFDRLRGDLA